jgi:plasmid stability protein
VTPHLRRSEIAQHLATLRPSLTAMQAARLAAVGDTVDDDGRFLLRRALEAAEFPPGDARAQDAFQDFRKRVNQAAAQAGVDLRLELDSRKASPDQRYGWFIGGDLVDEGIAHFTGEAARQTGIDHPVAPEVAELGPLRRTRVYVSFHPSTGATARRVSALLEQLRTALAADRGRSWEVVDPRSVGLGEDIEATRERLCAEADVRVVLLSPAYLADHAERRRALNTPGRVVTFALSGLPDGPLDLGPLRLHDVRRRNEPWDELTRTAPRRHYVADLVDEIRRALSPEPSTSDERTRDAILADWGTSVARSRRAGDSTHLVDSEAVETTLRESRLNASGAPTGSTDSSSGPPTPRRVRLGSVRCSAMSAWARRPRPSCSPAGSLSCARVARTFRCRSCSISATCRSAAWSRR